MLCAKIVYDKDAIKQMIGEKNRRRIQRNNMARSKKYQSRITNIQEN